MQKKKHFIDILFIILLIGIFALSSVMLTILGVKAYRSSATDNSAQSANTAALFFAQKIRQCEDKSTIKIQKLQNTYALTMKADSEKGAVITWLFVYDGYLRELTSIDSMSASAEFGQQILPMKAADFRIKNDNLLQVTLTEKNNNTSDIKLYLYNKGGSDE